MFTLEDQQLLASSEKQGEIAIPAHLICPLTQLIFLDPVTTIPGGHVYEKEIIDQLLHQATTSGRKLLCPITRTPIEQYVKAYNIEAAVEHFLKINPNACNQRYQREKADFEMPPLQKVHPQETFLPTTALMQQIEADRVLASKLQQSEDEQLRWTERNQAIERESRDRCSTDILIQQKIKENQVRKSRLAVSKNPVRQVKLDWKEEKSRERLIEDIQNLIYALGFEKGPQPKGRIDNFSLLFFAMIESAFLEPLPWQKISIADGPKSRAMYALLKAAIQALKTMDPEILADAKASHKGKYDLVKTVFGGELSLAESNYAGFAKTMGTITNQPGYLVDKVLTSVEGMLRDLCSKHQNLQSEKGLNL